MSFGVAAMTMVYNEAYFLPAWCRHYGAQLGYENLLVLDHGSDDGSTANLPCRKMDLARFVLDEEARAANLSALHKSLLNTHEVVIYVDADEFLVARPDKYPSLSAFLVHRPAGIIRCAGVSVVQHAPDLPKLDLAAPILRQRPYGVAEHWSCKPVAARVPVNWRPGLHDCAEPTVFDPDLWMFHLKHADYAHAFERLALTRTLRWRDDRYAGSHRITDEVLAASFHRRQASRRETSLADVDFAEIIRRRGESPLCRIPEAFRGSL